MHTNQLEPNIRKKQAKFTLYLIERIIVKVTIFADLIASCYHLSYPF